HIGYGIYCKISDYKNAVKGTPLASAVARNLLLGVFKREVLVQEFAKDYSKKKNWTAEASDSKIRNAMAQKIVELKGEHLKKLLVS
ncbi:hypothetical protein KQX54_000047, partial [Cotesia glomerata]